jgi:glutamate dehydrogenase (NADP+)
MEIAESPKIKLCKLAGSRFANALSCIKLSKEFFAALAEPRSVYKFSIPLRTDDGSLKMLAAWRLRFSDVLGPTKGGVRFYPGTNESDLTSLALRLVLKCAANSLPHGGAAGGVDIDPRQLTPSEMHRLSKSYVEILGDMVGAEYDILSPDLGTDSRIMGWMAEAYCKRRGVSIAGAINGKPLGMGGIPGRSGATARGAIVILEAVLTNLGLCVEGMRCAIQGFGNAGGQIALLLEQRGAKIVAACDRSGGLFNPSGLSATELWAAKEQGIPISNVRMKGAKKIPSSAVLTTPADIIIPAATAGQITKDVAARVQCKIVLEMANGPVASEAEPVLRTRGIEVIPDLIANAGGVTMSHFEWLQNRVGTLWSAEDAAERLEKKMSASAKSMIMTASNHKISLAEAAQIMALERLHLAICN